MAKYKLGEICEIVSGSTPKTGIAEYWDGNLKWITPAEIDDESYIITDSVRKLTELGVKKTGLSSFPSGTVILSSRAPIGKVAIAGCEMYCNQGFKNLICSDRINNRYLYWFLKGNTAYLNSLGRGATFKEISKKIVSDIEINVPEISQQLAAVDALERVSEIIRLRKNQLQKLDELVKARFVEMFGDCVLNTKSWNTKRLGDIAEVGSSKRVFVEDLKEKGIPFYRGTEIGALAEGKTVVPELFISEEHYSELCKATGFPQVGDFLMPSICPDGRIWIVNTSEPFYFKDGRVLWVHAINNSYNPVFLLHTLKDRIMTDYSSIASGTTFAELKIFALKECRIFDVPLELQNQFAAFVHQVDKSKVAVQKSLDEAQLLFDSLMQQYFG